MALPRHALDDLESDLPGFESWLLIHRWQTRKRVLFGVCVVCFMGLMVASLSAPTQGLETQRFGEENLRVSQQRVLEIEAFLQDKSVDEVLEWIGAAMPGRVVQFSSLGPSGLVILDKLASLKLLGRVPVVMIDTLHLFPETYLLARSISEKYPEMALHMFYPQGFGVGQREDFDKKYGSRLWSEDFDRYSYLTKVEPTQRALDSMSAHAWITGRRRSQGGEREGLRVVEWDDGRVKVNPLANWTLEQVWEYVRAHHVPYNALHDRGYASIGDTMTTRPLAKGEAERAGRFNNVSRTECGMHTHSASLEAMRQEALEHGQILEVPHVPCAACLEVRHRSFRPLVLETKQDMLIEFYSPFCGHCHAFAPKYDEIARTLQATQVIVARMDIINYKIPLAGERLGFKLVAYPTLYLVRVAGKLHLTKYEGVKEVRPIIDWLKRELPSLPGHL